MQSRESPTGLGNLAALSMFVFFIHFILFTCPPPPSHASDSGRLTVPSLRELADGAPARSGWGCQETIVLLPSPSLGAS